VAGNVDAVSVLDKIINAIPDYSVLTFVSKTSMTFKQSWLIKARVGLKFVLSAMTWKRRRVLSFRTSQPWTMPKSSSYSSLVSAIVLEACGHCTIQGFWFKIGVVNAGVDIADSALVFRPTITS
jgi:hypothetical protein